MVRAQSTALAELTVAYSNVKWKQKRYHLHRQIRKKKDQIPECSMGVSHRRVSTQWSQPVMKASLMLFFFAWKHKLVLRETQCATQDIQGLCAASCNDLPTFQSQDLSNLLPGRCCQHTAQSLLSGSACISLYICMGTPGQIYWRESNRRAWAWLRYWDFSCTGRGWETCSSSA